MNILLRIFIAAVLLIMTVGSGIWISSLGSSYKGILVTFHKLVALLTTINMVFFIKGLLEMGSVEIPSAFLLVVGEVSVIAIFVSGAMLRNGKMSCSQATTIHSFTSALAIVSIGIFLFMVIWGSMGIPV